MKKRIFLIVLDSFGIGEAPDADRFGDSGANTLRSVAKSREFSLKNLKKLGLFNTDGVDYLENEENPLGAYCRLSEKSAGKDTTVGHWEIAGYVSQNPLPVYPEGFPDEIIEAFSKATGRGVLCNRPYSGTQVIADYGAQHIKTGSLIVYTSADSVFQIAAHEDVVPPEKLYEYCREARKILTGRNGVGRVIARPFTGDEKNGFVRTSRRHDFSLEPPAPVLPDAVKA
ncbi:MAG: phosphopentomutase, partial [Clostridia bacterium]|nr:phosphopentomutase [Clostridia bacterium]